MKEHTERMSRRGLIAPLMVVALSVGAFAAPSTLADSSPKGARACSGADGPRDSTSHGWLDGGFRRSDLKVTPAAAPLKPAQSACAPHLYCLFAGCWYELLNNDTFDDPSCSPNWVFPAGSLTSSTVCNNMPYPVYSNSLVLPAASGFYQDFYVPADATRPLELSVKFATLGRPTSPYDRIIIELREYGLIVEQKTISTYQGPFDCHIQDLTFSKSYAGRNLRLRVRSVHVTPGVQYYIDSINLSVRP